jgi:hypothetical protein
MSFLAPLLLPALALASVPVIIHLLNRRRFQLVEWAPMKYLKLTLRTNRRRMRLEQLILLAVRTLAIVVLILAVARPVMSATGLGGWLTSRARTSRVLVLDDSLSMGHETDRKPAFAKAKDAAAALVRAIGSQDSVTALLTSAPNAPLVKDASLQDPNALLTQIDRARLSDTRSNWAAMLKTVDEHLASSPFPVREVAIVTDLRKAGWDAAVTELANRWAAQDVALRVIDVGSRATDNVTVTAFEPIATGPALPGAPLQMRVVIRNDGAAPVAPSQATLSIGDETRPVMLPELPAGQETEIPLSWTPQLPGQVALRLALARDALPPDDTRWLGVTVRPQLDITLVDGEPGSQPFAGETDFLALALSAGREPWQQKRQTDAEWLAARPDAADVTMLANVAAVSPERVAALERQVRDGMGLVIFVGDGIDPELYNQRLYRDGAGLLPAKLETFTDEPVTGLVVEPLEMSPLEPLRKIAPAALARIQTKRYAGVSLPTGKASDDVRVLARWNDAAAGPAVIEKRIGRGRVLLWTVTADRQWGDWPIDPTYVLAMRSAVASIARGEPRQTNVVAGEPLRMQLEPGQAAIEPKASAPDAGESVVVVESGESGGPLLTYARTPTAGPYTMTWKDAQGGPQSSLFAVSPDVTESKLEPISDDELTLLFGNLTPTIIHYSEGLATTPTQGREIWRTLAAALLALLLVESALAVWVGRER